MADIFISYKREDREWAKALAAVLERQGWSVWWDARIRGGSRFGKVISAELAKARCVIVLWSNRSIDSEWVLDEAQEGKNRDILVPLFIEKVTPPMGFRRIHALDFVGWSKSGDDHRIHSLVEDLNYILGPPPIQTIPPQNKAKIKKKPNEVQKPHQAIEQKGTSSKESVQQELITERRRSKQRVKGVQASSHTPVIQNDHSVKSQVNLQQASSERSLRAKWVGGALGVAVLIAIGFSNWPSLTGNGTSDVEGVTEAIEDWRSWAKTITRSGIEFVLIEPGEFDMGSDSEEASDDEQPVRRVHLTDAFYVGKTEITQAQWERVMGTTLEEQMELGGASALYGRGDQYPMYYVSWEDAQLFIERLNAEEGCDSCYRLPTEAEWEYAARAGTSTAYSFGDNASELGSYGWYSENSAHPVGEKLANGNGLHDMHGNVWEWVSDWYGEYENGTVTNPKGPTNGSYRVIRGGGWLLAPPGTCGRRIAAYSSPGFRDFDLGFRLVRTYP